MPAPSTFWARQSCTAALTERFAELAAEEAIAESGIGAKGDFPGPLFVAVPPIEVEWTQRIEIAAKSGANDKVTYNDLLRASPHFAGYHERFLIGSVADHLADKFGSKGSPISLSTACASGATAIQLGVEAIRRGETDAALCVGTDGSISPEAVIRFSLLSALSTSNDSPQAASRPFSKNRDGFIMAEGAGALVLESYDSAKARGAKILGVLEGCGEMTDAFHRTRSSPDGKPIIGCIASAIADAGLKPDDIDYVNAHGTSHAGKRQDGISRLLHRVRRAHEEHPDLVQQIDDRPHAVGGGRGRGGVHAAHAAARAHSAHHQLQHARSGDPARRGSQQGARRQGRARHFEFFRLWRAERLAGDGPGAGGLTPPSSAMRALRLIADRKLELADVPAPPPPGDGEVQIRVKSVALNHLDLWGFRGMAFTKRKLPLVVGAEASGEIAAVGGGVTGFKSGDKVVMYGAMTCGHCAACREGRDNLCENVAGIMGFHIDGFARELINLPARLVMPVPAGVSLRDASCAPIAFGTTEHMLFDNAKLKPGETILVHAGGSGIGSVAIKMAKAIGCTVITTVGDDAKVERAKAIGADHVINYKTERFEGVVRKLTAKKGVDVVFEHVGGEGFNASLFCLKRGGRWSPAARPRDRASPSI